MKLVTETKFGCRSERHDDLLLRSVSFCDKFLHGPFPFSSAAMCSLEVTGPSGGGSSLFELNTPRRRRQRTMPQSFYRDALIPPGRTVPQAGLLASYNQPGAITFQGPFSHRRVLENAPQCHRFGKAGHCGFDP